MGNIIPLNMPLNHDRMIRAEAGKNLRGTDFSWCLYNSFQDSSTVLVLYGQPPIGCGTVLGLTPATGLLWVPLTTREPMASPFWTPGTNVQLGHLVPVISDHPGHLILMDTLYRLYIRICIPYKLAQLWLKPNRLQQHPFCCHLTAQPTRNGDFMAHVDLYRHRSVYISI